MRAISWIPNSSRIAAMSRASAVFDQCFSERYPHISRVAETMQQEHHRALTADPNILGATAYRHLPSAKGVGPDADRSMGCRRPGYKRRGEGRQRCGEQWMQRGRLAEI